MMTRKKAKVAARELVDAANEVLKIFNKQEFVTDIKNMRALNRLDMATQKMENVLQ
jgi:hypothetical protein